MHDFRTKEQKMAEKAHDKVSGRSKDPDIFKDYKSFALSFPSLIHTCGLVQAVAFAAAKSNSGKNPEAVKYFIADLQEVFDSVDEAGNLHEASRTAGAAEYMRITRNAISAASWIKRFCQATD